MFPLNGNGDSGSVASGTATPTQPPEPAKTCLSPAPPIAIRRSVPDRNSIGSTTFVFHGGGRSRLTGRILAGRFSERIGGKPKVCADSHAPSSAEHSRRRQLRGDIVA